MRTGSSRESVIEQALVQAVTAAGGVCEKVVSKSRRGWPDRDCYLPRGRHILVETKRPKGGRLSPHQVKLHEELRALGHIVVVVWRLEDIAQIVVPLLAGR